MIPGALPSVADTMEMMRQTERLIREYTEHQGKLTDQLAARRPKRVKDLKDTVQECGLREEIRDIREFLVTLRRRLEVQRNTLNEAMKREALK